MSQKNISSKLPKAPLSIFAEMTRIAELHSAVNLAQGFPDFLPDTKLINLVTAQMKMGKNQYAPPAGVAALRRVIIQHIERTQAVSFNPDTEVTVTCGATQAIYTAIATLIREGNEVIVFEPAYESYIPCIRINQGIAKVVELKSPNFRINWNEVKRLISINTRMIVLNSPHNPTGMMLDETDLAELASLVSDKEIFILSDEVYELIRFDGNRHLSIASVDSLKEQTLTIGSFGKSTHTTGWKVGYCVAPAYITTEFRKMHQNMVFSVNTPMQNAFAEYLSKPGRLDYLPEFYQKKRDLFTQLMGDTGFKLLTPQGSYFQLGLYESLSDKNDREFAIELAEHGVATVPLSAFYSHSEPVKLLRFCFAKNDATLELATKNLRAYRATKY